MWLGLANHSKVWDLEDAGQGILHPERVETDLSTDAAGSRDLRWKGKHTHKQSDVFRHRL